MAGGKPGFVLSSRPRRYKTTPQQKRVSEAAEHCGIKKGITRAELVDAMTNCIPEYFKEVRERETPAP
jgi:hypothetical protein